MEFINASFNVLQGKVLTSIEGETGGDSILFMLDDGSKYMLLHNQDCCESVYVESIVGDFNDLIGEPLLIAEEVTSDENPADVKPETIEYQESFTWTFYKLATRKGYVDIRWYGESNGYYGESVDFEKVVE